MDLEGIVSQRQRGGYGGCWRYDAWGRWRNFCLPPPYGYY